MANFNLEDLNESSFKGYPFYTQSTSHSGGKRLSIHKFINGGTKAEENGSQEKKFTIEAYIGGEGYLKRKEEFIKVLDSTGSGELIDMFYGSKTVKVDSWTSTETKTKLGMVTFSINFVVAEDGIIQDEKIVYNVDLKEQSIANFKNEYNPNIGDDLLKDVSQNIKDTLKKSSDTFKFMDDAYGFASDTRNTIASTTNSVDTNLKSVTGLSDGILSIANSFEGILELDTFEPQETKTISNNIKTSLQDATTEDFDNTVEESVSKNSKAYNIALNSIILQIVIQTLEIVDFSTGDDFGDVKTDVLESFDILIKDVESNEDDKIQNIQARQDLLDKYKEGRKEFVTFYTAKYSKLQNLSNYDYVATTSVLDICIDRYKNLDRADEVIDNNDLLDPLFVNGELRLLDR